MSTRKLILTALICGMAIMLAGGVKLFQVVSEDKVAEVLALGTESKVSDMTVTVTAVDKQPYATIVHVRMSGVEGADGYEGWQILADGELAAPVMNDEAGPVPACTTRADVPVECDIRFIAAKGTVTVAYARAGSQSQWAS